jgi:hypothetical protein
MKLVQFLFRLQNFNSLFTCRHTCVSVCTGATEKNAVNSGTCSLEMKSDVRVLFGVFASSIETVFLR